MVTWAITLNALCILPSFLVGAIAHQIQSDFSLNDVSVGLAFSGYWLVASLAAIPCSRLVKRWGTIPSLQIAGGAAGLASILIPLVSHVDYILIPLVSISGLATALATPAVSVVIMAVVASGRQAFALTAAGASPVLSLMVAGVAATAIGQPFGWRWIYLINGGLAIVLAMSAAPLRAVFKGSLQTKKDMARGPSLRPLAVMMIGVGAGNAAIGAATAFLVVAAPSSGVSGTIAAFAVAVASALSILFRLTMAGMIDRMRADPMLAVGSLMLCAAVGFWFLGLGTTTGFFVGLTLVLVLGWSWVSLLLFGVLARYRTEVASASGVIQMVFFIGGVAGPGAMGLLVGLGSFSMAWWCLACASVVAAAAVLVGRRSLPEFYAE